jgi:hypothetical protein
MVDPLSCSWPGQAEKNHEDLRVHWAVTQKSGRELRNVKIAF